MKITLTSLKQKLREDAGNALLLVVVAGLLGFGWNALRDEPLGLVYQDKKARLAADVIQLRTEGQGEEGRADNGEITADAIARFIKTNADVLLLDARPDLFYLEGHIPSAKNLSLEDFKKDYPKFKNAITRAGQVIVYCSDAHCETSDLVAGALRDLGHMNIVVYKGGWQEWSSQRRKIEK
jgi:3-mercaptopyruvate sulfurtransferase SseA